MFNKEDFKILLPHNIKQDILIDLLIQNLAHTKALTNLVIEEFAQLYHKDPADMQNEFLENVKQIKYDIIANIAHKYGK